MNLWTTFIYQPILNLFLFSYQAVGGNLGIAIIVLTSLVRLALVPLMIPSLQSNQKIQGLKPEMDKLKVKFGKDKQGLAKAQLDLYRQHNINPMGSLLPTIIQFVLIIVLFNVFNEVLIATEANNLVNVNQKLYNFIKLPEGQNLNSQFLYLNITKPDTMAAFLKIDPNQKIGPINSGIIPGPLLLGAVVLQFFSTKLMTFISTEKNKPKKEDKKLKKKEKVEEKPADDMATSIQKQMLIIGPLMTLIIGIKFASGIVLYWLVVSLSIIFQQLYMNKKVTNK